jgi:hemolysin activation/secretion protein
VSIGLEDKLFEGALLNGLGFGQEDRRSRPITLGYTARTETDTSVWGYDASFAVNTGQGSHNDLASYQTEDPRVDTVHWKALRGTASYTAPLLGSAWLWTARGAWQFSPDVLIAGEQFGLGGLGSVRGTEIERPITGDKGLSATLEASTPELAPGMRVLGFVDAGYVRNNKPDGLANPSSDRVASVGMGVRYATGAFAASLDYGVIVKGSRVPLSLNADAPKRGNDRIYVSVSIRF